MRGKTKRHRMRHDVAERENLFLTNLSSGCKLPRRFSYRSGCKILCYAVRQRLISQTSDAANFKTES